VDQDEERAGDRLPEPHRQCKGARSSHAGSVPSRGTTAAGAVFSTSIGFLFLAFASERVWGLSGPPSGLLAVAVLSVVIAAMYASVTTGAMLDRDAIRWGSAVGAASLAPWWSADPGEQAAVPYLLLLPVTAAVLVVVGVRRMPGRVEIHLFSRSRALYLMHALQGGFIFGLVLPGALTRPWPRPFAAALIGSAFVLWKMWNGCPLTIAENRLRVLEGKPAISVEEGFISHRLARWGISVSGRTVARGLRGLGFFLCGWWAIEWALRL
jgi:hypothetical protein